MPRGNAISDAMYLRVHELRAQNKSYDQISLATGISKSYIGVIIAKNLTSRPAHPSTKQKRVLTAEQVSEIMTRLSRNERQCDIAKIMGIPAPTICHYAKRERQGLSPFVGNLEEWYDATRHKHPWVQSGGLPRVGAPVYADSIFYGSGVAYGGVD
jgi:hypothetical protein